MPKKKSNAKKINPVKFDLSSRLTIWSVFLIAVVVGVGLIFIWFPHWFSNLSMIVVWSLLGLMVLDRMICLREFKCQSGGTLRELTETNRKLKSAGLKIKELQTLRDEFISMAAHQLRTPMTTIKGNIAMILKGDAGKIPPMAREFLEDAYKGNEQMVRLISNMLNVSQIESGQLIVNLSDVQIENLIMDVIDDFAMEAKSHGLELKYLKSKPKLPKVRVDPAQIKEVLANIIGNAIAFTPHGHVHVKSYLEADMVVVAIQDTGVGIAPSSQKQLFKKFSRLAQPAPFKKGSGLGLYICKMLLNEFGGKIWLKSAVGKGTTFYFSLPAIQKTA
jgi:signal transduction histidine kinase